MVPLPLNTAPMAPGSSNLQGSGSQIQYNDNTFLTTIGGIVGEANETNKKIFYIGGPEYAYFKLVFLPHNHP